MKVKYIAMLLAVSLLSVGVVSCDNSTDSNTGVKQENPCAGNPCAGKDPCAGNPCAGVDPCAGENPCAAEKK